MTILNGSQFQLRPWQTGDEDALLRHANDEAVSRDLADRFPYPYTLANAEWWIREGHHCELVSFAIVVDGEACGGIGCQPNIDVYRYTGEIGYWLGRAFWGRGIVSEAVGLFVPHVFENTQLIRLEAGVFDRNPASMRVLEKNGFTRDGIRRDAVVKRGELMDLYCYARVCEDPRARLAVADSSAED